MAHWLAGEGQETGVPQGRRGPAGIDPGNPTVLDIGAVTARTPPSLGVVSHRMSWAVRLSDGLWQAITERNINKLADGAYPACVSCYVFFCDWNGWSASNICLSACLAGGAAGCTAGAGVIGWIGWGRGTPCLGPISRRNPEGVSAHLRSFQGGGGPFAADESERICCPCSGTCHDRYHFLHGQSVRSHLCQSA